MKRLCFLLLGLFLICISVLNGQNAWPGHLWQQEPQKEIGGTPNVKDLISSKSYEAYQKNLRMKRHIQKAIDAKQQSLKLQYKQQLKTIRDKKENISGWYDTLGIISFIYCAVGMVVLAAIFIDLFNNFFDWEQWGVSLMLVCIVVGIGWGLYYLEDRLKENKTNYEETISILEKDIQYSRFGDQQWIEFKLLNTEIQNNISRYENHRRKIMDSLDMVKKHYSDSIDMVKKQKEVQALQAFIKKNSVKKILRIVSYDWQKEKDIPEKGTLNGTFVSKGGGGGLVIRSVFGQIYGAGAGGSKSDGKLQGEFTGRIEGEPHRYLHLILQDNSYYMIDTNNAPAWRMVSSKTKVLYEKVYTSYTHFEERLKPIYI